MVKKNNNSSKANIKDNSPLKTSDYFKAGDNLHFLTALIFLVCPEK